RWSKSFSVENSFFKYSAQPFLTYSINPVIHIQLGARFSRFDYSNYYYKFTEKRSEYLGLYGFDSPIVQQHHEYQLDDFAYWRIDPYLTLRCFFMFLQVQTPIVH